MSPMSRGLRPHYSAVIAAGGEQKRGLENTWALKCNRLPPEMYTICTFCFLIAQKMCKWCTV